jgi:hypothetical protein
MLENASAFLAADPSVLALQILMMSGAFLVVFLVLFVTRDVILRSHSFLFQVFCILLAALLPVAGFFLYLLIRPSTTLFERSLHRKVTELLQKQGKKHEPKPEKPKQK